MKGVSVKWWEKRDVQEKARRKDTHLAVLNAYGRDDIVGVADAVERGNVPRI